MLVRWFVALFAAALLAAGHVVLTPVVASAAPHYTRPPTVQLGYTDRATPQVGYDWEWGENLPLGAWRDGDGRIHVSRVYVTFDVSQLAGQRIVSSTAWLEEDSAADCPRRAMEIWLTRTVDRTPSWATAPEPLRKVDEVRATTTCPSRVSFDVSSAVRDAVADGSQHITFEIKVARPHELDPRYGRQLYWYTGVPMSVEHNSPPRVVAEGRYNGGFRCTGAAPYRAIGPFVERLQAFGADADENDEYLMTHEFEVWPHNNPDARIVLTDDTSIGFLGSVRVPDDFLADGDTYAWRVRVNDGLDTSAWSDVCSFVVDRARPAAPQVSSPDYPPYENGQVVPAAEPGQFTFSADGDTDTIGFEYGWDYLGVPVCEYGQYGLLICRDPFDRPNTVRADVPGGTATVSLSPPWTSLNTLVVRSIDAAGNRSDLVEYQFYAWNQS